MSGWRVKCNMKGEREREKEKVSVSHLSAEQVFGSWSALGAAHRLICLAVLAPHFHSRGLLVLLRAPASVERVGDEHHGRARSARPAVLGARRAHLRHQLRYFGLQRFNLLRLNNLYGVSSLLLFLLFFSYNLQHKSGNVLIKRTFPAA